MLHREAARGCAADDTRFLVVVARPDAVHAWEALHEAGQDLGVGSVGREASIA